MDDSFIRKKGIYLLSLYLTLNGHIHQSEAFLTSLTLDDKGHEISLITQIIGDHLDILVHFYGARNRECIELVLNRAEISGLKNAHFWLIPLWGHAVAASLSEGDVDGATQFLQKMKSRLVNGHNIETFYYDFLHSWSLLSKDLFVALPIAQNALNLAIGLGVSYLVHTCLIAVAQIYYELGQEEQSLERQLWPNPCCSKARQ